jgi:hypothetical protein
MDTPSVFVTWTSTSASLRDSCGISVSIHRFIFIMEV